MNICDTLLTFPMLRFAFVYLLCLTILAGPLVASPLSARSQVKLLLRALLDELPEQVDENKLMDLRNPAPAPDPDTKINYQEPEVFMLAYHSKLTCSMRLAISCSLAIFYRWRVQKGQL